MDRCKAYIYVHCRCHEAKTIEVRTFMHYEIYGRLERGSPGVSECLNLLESAINLLLKTDK